ncbi:MAG: hypothetical protein J5791_10395 [Fibrobacter sp.]|nr:hypothetical protein [Fibrobacter sp.]
MKIWFPLVLAALALIACGEDSETVRVTDRYTLDMLGKGVSLTEEKCDSARIGQLLYVGDSSSIYYCTGKAWKKVNGKDGTDGRDGKDGTDGTDGRRGENGTSGTDCFIEDFAEGFVMGCGATKAVVRYDFELPDTCRIALRSDSSYVLTCGKDSATIVQGPQGDDGDICKQTDIGGGQVRLVCGGDSVTLYKAACGDIPFDPDGSLFCYGDTLVQRCGSHIYDIKKQFCYGDSLVDMCGGKTYDLTQQFCFSDSLVGLCGGESYNPEAVFCSSDSIVTLCGGESFNVEEQFCYGDTVVTNCDGEDYDLAQQFCYEDSLVSLCGGKDYDLAQQFCYRDSIVSLCGGKDYDLTRQFCYGDSLIDLCGGSDYNPKQQFCYNDSLVDLCGGKSYDLELKFCDNGSLVNLCGGKDYNPKQQFCYNDSLVDMCGGRTYDLESAFCYNGRITPLCGGVDFQPNRQFCYNDSLVDMCNGEAYDVKQEFCYYDSLVNLCGGEDYDLSVQFCYDNLLYDLCGGESYDVRWYTCYDNEIVPYECRRKPEYYRESYVFEQEFCYVEKDTLTGYIIDEYLVERCGGKSYDLKQKFCYNDELIDLCGGREYNPQEQFCEINEVMDWCRDKKYAIGRQFCDERNWRVYRYTTINGVTWMADNLDFRVPNSFCDSLFKDDWAHCGPKGRFYVWSAAMDLPESECGYGHSCGDQLHYPHQGVCPDGWHLPTKAEWDALIDFMGRGDFVYWDDTVLVRDNFGRNEYGFSAIPTGFVVTDSNHVGTCKHISDDRGFIPNYEGYSYCRLSDGTKNSAGFDAWTSTESLDSSRPGTQWVHLCVFYADNQWGGSVTTPTWRKYVSRTVRCVKNESENDDQ